MYIVQFYSFFTQDFVTISKHRKLENAVKKARLEYINGEYFSEVTILFNQNRLDRYGKKINK